MRFFVNIIVMNIHKEVRRSMKRSKGKELLKGKEIPRLSDCTEKDKTSDVYEKRLKKIRKITSLYFFTAGLLVLTILVIWSSGSVSPYALRTRSFFGIGADKVVKFIVKGNFFGGIPTDDNTEDKEEYDDQDVLKNEVSSVSTEAVFDTVETQPNDDVNKNPAPSIQDLYFFDHTAVPDGETAIIPMDLSLSSSGAEYINNSTGYSPDTAKLLASALKDHINIEYLASSGSPIVLIVHTHATEAYSEDGAISYLDTGGEYARSSDIKNNVVAVGRILAQELNNAGIPTLQSTILHDAAQYKDSYARSEETIRQYLEKYPSIRLVIDLHRDAIVRSNGALVRPVALSDGEAAAQVMCVVGSDWGGQSCPNWEGNLALALKLREALNSKTQNICRPPYLKSSTYNQELAPYSLLLEMGSSGNSLEEAGRSARLVANALFGLIGEL